MPWCQAPCQDTRCVSVSSPVLRPPNMVPRPRAKTHEAWEDMWGFHQPSRDAFLGAIAVSRHVRHGKTCEAVTACATLLMTTRAMVPPPFPWRHNPWQLCFRPRWLDHTSFPSNCGVFIIMKCHAWLDCHPTRHSTLPPKMLLLSDLWRSTVFIVINSK